MHQRGESSILGQQLGPYYVSDRIGRGGMGAVYRARDMALDRPAALKVLLPAYADDPEFVARFQREARAAARLNHPNIVQIYAVDIESDPAYMAMEFVDGETLDARLRSEGAMKWQTALSVISQVAAALTCAHAAGIIHRDIKPANVLIDKSNRVKVADFGIAKVVGSQTRLTGTQNTVGSPCYMSPEQCGVGEVTPASDLFSLGIMFYELLTDDLPFKGESGLAVMRQITTEELPPLSGRAGEAPSEVQLLLQCLAARELSLRYGSAQQVLEDLRSFQAGKPMVHAQGLALKRGGLGPPTATAADLTRSPTGPSPALKTSLVSDLLDDMPGPAPHPVRRSGVEVPWIPILGIAAVALVVLAAIAVYRMRPPGGALPPPREGAIAAPTGPLEGVQPPPGTQPPRPRLGPDGRRGGLVPDPNRPRPPRAREGASPRPGQPQN